MIGGESNDKMYRRLRNNAKHRCMASPEDTLALLDEIEELQKKLDLIEPFCSRDPEQIYADYALTETTKDNASDLALVDAMRERSVSERAKPYELNDNESEKDK